MDQISGTTPTDAPTQAQDDSQAAVSAGSGERSQIVQPGFGSRGRARRRARFLRKARELAYRDLGGLVFNLHRFGQRNDALVLAKLTTLGRIDGELRSIEAALQEREAVTVLREAGITACPRCAAIHSSEDRFCPNCGLSMSRHVDLPVAGAAAPATPAPLPPPPSAGAAPIPQPVAPAQPAAPTPPPPAPEAPVEPAPVEPAPVEPAPAESAVAPATPTAPPQAETQTPVPAHQLDSTSEGRPSTPPVGAGGEQDTEIIRPGAPGS